MSDACCNPGAIHSARRRRVLWAVLGINANTGTNGGVTVAYQYSGMSLGNSGDELAAAWTPDGRGIVFATTVNRHESAFAEGFSSLYRVDAAGGEPVRLTTDAAEYGAPRFSADGRTVAFTL